MKTKSKDNIYDGWQLVVATNLKEVEAIRPAWKQLQDEEYYPVFFADIDRFISVIKASNGDMQPYVMLFKHNGCPEVMMSGSVKKQPLECRIGRRTLFKPSLRRLSIVYGGILGKQTDENCVVVIRELMKLLRRREVDVVFINRIRTDSPLYRLVRKMLPALSRAFFPRIENHWCMSIPETIDVFYQARSKRHRGNLRRYIRKLAREYPNKTKVVTYHREDELDDAIKAASQISAKTYQHAYGSGFRDDYWTRTLLSTAAKFGWLRIHILYIDQEPCAFQIGMQYGEKYFLRMMGFDPKWKRFHIGTVLFLQVLENICKDPKVELLDFGFEEYEYKRSYGDKRWSETFVYIFAPRLFPVFVNIVRSFMLATTILLKYLMTKIGIYEAVRRFRWTLVQRKNTKVKD